MHSDIGCNRIRWAGHSSQCSQQEKTLERGTRMRVRSFGDPISGLRTSANAASLTIRQKQLLTLAGAVGILACGACFAPPRYASPPPPPLQIDLHGVRTISVEVTSSSEAQHMDTVDLAKKMHEVLDVYRKDTGVAAATPGKPADATLRIKLLKAVAVPLPMPAGTEARKWTIELRYSAALVARDGTVLWGESDVSRTIPETGITAEDSESFWQNPSPSFPWINNRMSFWIARQMYYGATK